MNRNKNIRIIREPSRDVKQISPNQSAGGNSAGISFAEFAERLEQHAAVDSPVTKSFKDVARIILNIISFDLFNEIKG